MSYQRLFILTIALFCFTVSTAHAKVSIVFKFNGITGDILTNTQRRLDIVTKSYAPLTPQKINTIYEQAPQEIKKALQPYGYFNADIHSKLIRNKNVWTAQFDITTNSPIRISQLTVDIIGAGKDNHALNKFINHLPMKIDAIFRTDTYEQTKESLFHLAINNGYIKAKFTTNQIIIDPISHTAKIKLIFDTGALFYFGKINFGPTPYSSDFLKRFVSFNEKTPYSSDKLLKLQQSIANTGYFQKVLITPDFKKAPANHVPINVFLIPPKAKKYSIGVGYGTITGPRLTTNISFRRLTSSGQHLDTQFKLSQVVSGLAAKYYIPGKSPLNDEWVIGTNYQRFLPKNGSSTSGKVTAGYLTKSKESQTTIDLNYLLEKYKVKNQKGEKTQLLYPNLNFIYSKSDDLINPTFGKLFNVTVRGASRALISSTSFFQTEVKTKYFFTPFNFAHVILRSNVGYTVASDLNKLPLSMRFFAGGMNSIRGYPESYIGPGRYLYTGSIEYQNRIKDNWWGAVFYDGGTATNHFGDKMYYGKGVGLIYTSVIGPIKLYVGEGSHRSKKKYSVEFSIGPEF
jgi:translocation and assembly module TamA